MFIAANGSVYRIAITDASQLHPQAKVIDWLPEDAQGICYFFQDALGEDCLEHRETAALAFPLINSVLKPNRTCGNEMAGQRKTGERAIGSGMWTF
jgi:hypothetical protein